MNAKKFYDICFLINLVVIYAATALFLLTQNLLLLLLAAFCVLFVAAPLHNVILIFEVDKKVKKNTK